MHDIDFKNTARLIIQMSEKGSDGGDCGMKAMKEKGGRKREKKGVFH